MFKKDEMEKEIEYKSISISYYFTIVILSIWIIINIFLKQNTIIPLYILITELLIKNISKLIIKKTYGDDRWKKFLVGLFCIIFLIIFILTISIG